MARCLSESDVKWVRMLSGDWRDVDWALKGLMYCGRGTEVGMERERESGGRIKGVNGKGRVWCGGRRV